MKINADDENALFWSIIKRNTDGKKKKGKRKHVEDVAIPEASGTCTGPVYFGNNQTENFRYPGTTVQRKKRTSAGMSAQVARKKTHGEALDTDEISKAHMVQQFTTPSSLRISC